jgi:DNA primase small subunit
MEDRTRAYLRGRFGDHYRRAGVTPPPEPAAREWGYVPWSGGMVRHRSLLGLGSLEAFLERERPRHVYHSAARYDDPGADHMGAKGRTGADLVFDLDADHLPGVSEGDPYPEMLAACKGALLNLLDFLESDFGFTDLTVVFSGGRGYHVHVRDDDVASLDSSARREIVDYVLGEGVDRDALVQTVAADGATRRELRVDGGWGRRVHERLRTIAADLREAEEDAAMERLLDIEGIGEQRATAILRAVKEHPEAIETGNLEAGGPGMRTLLDTVAEQTVADEHAPIDEPVTTDTSRLIRLPGSLHGGTGLVVCPIPRDELDAFDPLDDAVASAFRGHEIAIDVTEPVSGRLDGEAFAFQPGTVTVPEALGLFLMARGAAEKGREA